MATKNLVIVESPNKVKKIKSFLGDKFEVVASVGHIRDLPTKGLGVNLKKDFEPTYEVYPDKKDIVKKIISAAKKADIVYLMMDADREGHGISYHIASLLPKNTKYKRAVSYSITKSEVKRAIEEAGEIDMDLVNAYECRRILDRLVGYRTSFITKQATGGSSAGRVQSAALRILTEREKEIKAFVPQEYWSIDVELLTDKYEKILAKIKIPKELDIKTKEQADKICDAIKKGPVKVSKFEKKEHSVKPYGPFKTSTMTQTAGSILGWKADKTMRVAQDIYTDGLCTYHRTDSTFIVPEFVAQIRNQVEGYGDGYLPNKPNLYSSSKNAQEAHEACRVTDLIKLSANSIDKSKLYTMIWKRTVASQMNPMIQMRASAEFSCDKYVLNASGSKAIFDGWRKVWDYGSVSDTELPELEIGQELKVLAVKAEQKFTQPPPHFTVSSFDKELEKRGIGRPSTAPFIPRTLEDRGYIEIKKHLQATDLGIRVSDFLVGTDFCFVDLSFTTKMEEKLDGIAQASANKIEILTDFWNRLKSDIENAKKKKNEMAQTDFECPKCHANLLMKHSKYGPFFSCSNYSNKENKCDFTAHVGDDGQPEEKKVAVFTDSEHDCPNCGELLIVRQGKRGEYLGCRNWRDVKCQGFYGMDGIKFEFKKKKRRAKKN